MDNHDPYVILGIGRDATNEEIADAYRELLSICFGRDVSQFRRIVRAYLQLSGMGPDDAWSSPTLVHTKFFRWFRSNGFRITCFIGGSVLFGVIAYKAFQLSKTIQSSTLTDLENSSSQVIKAPITIILDAWQWSEKTTTSVSQWVIENPPFHFRNGVGESRASIPSHCLLTGSSLTAFINMYRDGQSSNAIVSTSTTGAWQWSEKTTTSVSQWIIDNPPFQNRDEVGESRASIPSHCLVTGSSLTALVNQYRDGQSSNAIASTPATDEQSSNGIGSTVSSTTSSTLGACSKALKWTAGSVGSAWKWSVDKVTSTTGDGQSSNEIGSTASSISNSTLGACSKALKWTEGSVGAAWQWTTGKISSQSSESTSAAAATSVGVLSKIWKWASGRS